VGSPAEGYPITLESCLRKGFFIQFNLVRFMEKASGEFETQIGYDLIKKIHVPIGEKEHWEDTGKREKGRVVWRPLNEQSKKADPGRSHWCCYRACIPLIVNQGAKNSWSFRRKGANNSSQCNVQKTITDFVQSKKTNEGAKHKYAKDLLVDYLTHQEIKTRLNIKRVDPEKRFTPSDIVIFPDITITHTDGTFTFVEIVDYSSPHKNTNAWKFYENQQENLVVIDIKHNQEGWHFNAENIQMILIEKFERHFADRTNYAKIWDEVNEVLVHLNEIDLENNFSQPWKGLDSFKLSFQNWLNYSEMIRDKYQNEFETLVNSNKSIQWIFDEHKELISNLKERNRIFRPQDLPKGKTIYGARLGSMMREEAWRMEFRRLQRDYEGYAELFLYDNCKLIMFGDELIFTDVKYYYKNIEDNWNTLDDIQHKHWISENWNLRLKEQAEIKQQLVRTQEKEIQRKISILHDHDSKKVMSPQDMAELHTILQEGSIEYLVEKSSQNIKLLESDLQTFARIQHVDYDNWKFIPEVR